MRPNATDSSGTLDVTARLRIRRHVERVLEPQLLLRELELGRIVGEHLPAPERVVVAGLAVDRDADVDVLAVLLARGGRERCLERLEDDLLVDALLVGDGVDDHQDLFVHRASSRLAGLLRLRRQVRLAYGRDRQQHAAARPPRPRSSSSPRRDQRPREPTPAVDRLRRARRNTFSPTNRANCSRVRSGRSSPGDDTSSVYWSGNGSCASSTSLTARLTRSQSSSVMPRGAVDIQPQQRVAPPRERTRAPRARTPDLRPPAAAGRSSVSLSIARPRPPAPETKNGPAAHSFLAQAAPPPAQMKNPRARGFLWRISRRTSLRLAVRPRYPGQDSPPINDLTGENPRAADSNARGVRRLVRRAAGRASR